jgi:Tfp pilus assembly protein PilF
MADVLKLEADAATAIAQQIHAYVGPDENRRLTRAPQVQPAAYEEYLRGRHLFLVVNKQAVEHFRRAIQLRPDYAPAYAGLSMALQSFDLRDLNGARAAADKALELDPELPEAHSALAGLKQEDYDWRDAEKEYERALNLNPYSLNSCIAIPSSSESWADSPRRWN